jgi:hypothetical protein
MKFKLDVFTIFIIILTFLVLFTLLNKWYICKPRETFIDFNKQQGDQNSYISIYIPQYSTDTNRRVIQLYDNLYFDKKNGVVLEIDGTQTKTTAADITGQTIAKIHIIPRNGNGNIYTTYQSVKIGENISSIDTTESLITTTSSLYNQYTYKTNTLITDGNYKYQYFYYSMNTQTFIHLFKYPVASTAGGSNKLEYIKSYILNPSDGLIYVVNATFIGTPIPDETAPLSSFVHTDANANDTTLRLPKYINGNVDVYKITASVLYDISNGYVILKETVDGTSDPTLTIYDRNGSKLTTPAIRPNLESLRTPIIFMCSNNKSGLVLVTSYMTNTIISVISHTADKKYQIIATKRFNKMRVVTDSVSDIDTPSPVTSSPVTSSPASTTKPNDNFNKWNDQYKIPDTGCGNDPTCWYWYFKTLPSFTSKTDTADFFSDDYFLKTEAVPPVCPQCPNCPSSGGACTSCGGNGGSGTNACSNINLQLTQVAPGRYQDNLKNVYIAYSDNSGNTKYILQGTSIATTAAIATTTPSASASGGNITAVDKNGQFITTADPNTVGGGLTMSVMSLDQAGTSLFNNTAGVANNVINTAGGVVGTAGDLAYSTGSGAVNLLKDTGSGAVNLLKDAGRGIANLGQGSLSQQPQQQGNGKSGPIIDSQNGSTSDKTFGRMQGQTPVDNYSYYGALQSKGGNFMPVTADFSSFRK